MVSRSAWLPIWDARATKEATDVCMYNRSYRSLDNDPRNSKWRISLESFIDSHVIWFVRMVVFG